MTKRETGVCPLLFYFQAATLIGVLVQGCTAITPSSYIRLDPLGDVTDVQDPHRDPVSHLRYGPRYVLVSLGREERWKIGSLKNMDNIAAFISPEIKNRGWCPDSFTVLEKTIGGSGDLGLQFIVKCKTAK